MISVVIPFHSNFNWLIQAIESVRKQTYENYEIIIINDGCPENDSAFLEKYKDGIKYFKFENQGPAKARNIGIEMSSGEFIAFLDSDDLWEPNKLEEQFKYMISNKFIWSHTGYSLFDGTSRKELDKISVSDFSGDVFLKCLISSPIATPCVMIKREFLIRHPEIRFAENMRYGQDGFMWLNIARYENLGVVSKSLSNVRIRGGNAALKARVYLKVKSQIWEFIKFKLELNDEKFRNIPFLIKYIYRLCSYSNTFINLLEVKYNMREKVSEQLSRALYFPLYIVLKLIKLFRS